MATLDLSTDTIQLLVDEQANRLSWLKGENTHLERTIDNLEQTVRNLTNEALDQAVTIRRLREQIEAQVASNDYAVSRLRLQNAELAQQVAAGFDYSTLDGMDFIPAIKTLREQTGLGLREAKETVERAWKDGKFKFKDGYVPQAYVNDPEQWTDPKG